MAVVVKDPVRKAAYNLSDLDNDQWIRIMFTGPWGKSKSVKCYAEEYEHFRNDLLNKGCEVDTVFLSNK